VNYVYISAVFYNTNTNLSESLCKGLCLLSLDKKGKKKPYKKTFSWCSTIMRKVYLRSSSGYFFLSWQSARNFFRSVKNP